MINRSNNNARRVGNEAKYNNTNITKKEVKNRKTSKFPHKYSKNGFKGTITPRRPFSYRYQNLFYGYCVSCIILVIRQYIIETM